MTTGATTTILGSVLTSSVGGRSNGGARVAGTCVIMVIGAPVVLLVIDADVLVVIEVDVLLVIDTEVFAVIEVDFLAIEVDVDLVGVVAGMLATPAATTSIPVKI